MAKGKQRLHGADYRGAATALQAGGTPASCGRNDAGLKGAPAPSGPVHGTTASLDPAHAADHAEIVIFRTCRPARAPSLAKAPRFRLNAGST
jgi:hypothetical protein